MPIADTMVDPRSGVEETIEIVTPLRSIKGFVARPAEKPSSAVIVAHGGDGLNDETREYCCTLAAAGLLALAPDFGYRHDATLRKDATHLHGELRATSAVLKSNLQAAALPVSVVGFGAGGLISLLAVSRGDARAAVTLYGDALGRVLRAVRGGFRTSGRRAGAILFVLGAADGGVSATEVGAMHECLTKLRVVHEFVVYPRVGDSFMRAQPSNHLGGTANSAWTKMLAWLRAPKGPKRLRGRQHTRSKPFV
jgi:dienelactone hydrolase